MGHVNNAAYWSAVEHVLVHQRGPDPREPLRARLDYRHPIDLGEDVELATDSTGGSLAIGFVAGERVRAVAVVDSI
jgi:acyl-ACP thioesterase